MPEPLVIRRSNDPFTWPEFAPDIKRLRYEIIGWDERNNALTRPLIRWAFDQEETAAFEQFLATKADQLATIRRIGEAWHFLDRALNFLLKACFTFGVEQLLWHTVAIEALLGEDRQGLVSQLKRRIAVVYPGDAGRKKRAAKVFDQDVYDLRSKLVHGGELREADRKDLRNARILARTIAVRMIEMLASLGAMIETKKLQALPSRVDVLESLDQIAEKREMALHPLAQAVSSALP